MKKTRPDSKPTNPEPTPQWQQQLEELQHKYARAVADYQNLEKRTQHQQAQYLHLAQAAMITRFINILDDLERAAKHLNDQGVDMIVAQFKKLLVEEGVQATQPVGEPFDPRQMECVDRVDGSKDQVIEVLEPGYTLNNHLIRPAKVTVGKG